MKEGTYTESTSKKKVCLLKGEAGTENPERTKTNPLSIDETKAVIDTLEKVGVMLNAYTKDQYISAAEDYGCDNLIRAIQKAALSSKQFSIPYVTAIARNAHNGTTPRWHQAKHRNGATINEEDYSEYEDIEIDIPDSTFEPDYQEAA